MTRRSPASAPDPSELGEALAHATRIRFREVLSERLLLELDRPEDLQAFGALLRVEPGEPFHCMCPGDQTIEIRRRGGRAVVTLHHGRSLRWDERWNTDVLLADPLLLLGWLAEHGLAAPLEAHRRLRTEAERGRAAWEAWLAAAPGCLAPLVEPLSASASGGSVDDPTDLIAAAIRSLREAYPEERDHVLALLAWFGSGEGPWSGFPSYEQVAVELLLVYPPNLLVEAVSHDEPTVLHLEGAARFFSSWWFAQAHPGEASRIPAEVAEQLLAHVDLTGVETKRTMLRAALGLRP